MQLLNRALVLTICLSALAALGACAHHSPISPSADLVIDNAFILTMEADGKQPYLGYLAIGSDGRIVQTDSGASPAKFSAAKHIDAHGMWMLPGFVSAHSHLWQSAFSGIAADQNLEGWLGELYGVEAPALDAEKLYALTKRGGIHHLQNGITTAFNFTFTGKDRTGLVDRCQLRGALDAGIRVVHGFNVRTVGKEWSVEQARERTAAFLSWANTQPEHDRYAGTVIAGAGVYSDKPAQTIAEAELMHVFGLRNQQHYLESPSASLIERQRYGWMKNAGMIGPDMIFGHFIHASPEIFQDAAQAGVSMSWNPLSNGRLGSGTPDIPLYRQHGLRIGMGTDGEASADRADPLENMRMGLYQVRALKQNAAVLSAYDVLWLHTGGSAEVLGLQDRIGSLRAGKHADFLLIDAGNFTPNKDPYAALVFAAGVENIDSVYVGGQLVAKQGRALTSTPKSGMQSTLTSASDEEAHCR